MFFKKKSTADQVGKLLAAGHTQDALDLCRRVCQKTGKATPQDWEVYGCLSVDTGDPATGRTALEQAVLLDPGLGSAQFALGKLLATMGDYPAALRRLQLAAELLPENADIRLAQGITCGLARQAAGAEGYCRQALELQPGSAAARFNLANALQVQGKLSESEAEYEAALIIAPDMVDGWYMLAQARVGLRKFAEAELAANRAIELEPRKGEAYFTLGNIADAVGNKEQARGHFRMAVKYLPRFPDAHMRLGQVLFDLNDYSGAADSFYAVTSLDARNVEAHLLMGKSFEESKLTGRAETCYRQVLALDPNHLSAHYCMAFICVTMGRHEEAAKHFSEILRINPGDEQARHLLAAQQGETTRTAPASYVATLFDGFADTFDSKLVDNLGYCAPEALYDIVNHYLAPVPGMLDVIDLGCGTGLCAPLFRPMARTLQGVDLSPGMINKARERALYDKLEMGDIIASLNASASAWDLAISTDVFIYVGDLSGVFTACVAALRPGGYFAFSIETNDSADDFVLRATGRYAHASAYIRRLATETGFVELGCRPLVLRKERGQDIHGAVFLLRRADAAG